MQQTWKSNIYVGDKAGNFRKIDSGIIDWHYDKKLIDY